jgi:hypothetical protein
VTNCVNVLTNLVPGVCPNPGGSTPPAHLPLSRAETAGIDPETTEPDARRMDRAEYSGQGPKLVAQIGWRHCTPEFLELWEKLVSPALTDLGVESIWL